ncbi:hypothetical protein QBC47DRAFT_408484 [Echria macrotheca]|uniref:Uncharacterized protein n=1 Tax=Echria macrotheca TaxID=438768 RepID=A0AAJ0BNS3_9PEZI|nr:hypothetical protein QBC47DRAFT_408484 [Echria macrotheca]
MHDNRTHPLLQQVPLTVSPFVNLPSATTLPYTYRPMPSALPQSTTGIGISPIDNPQGNQDPNANRPRYVLSSSGYAAHPEDIRASCAALCAHLDKLEAEAQAKIKELDELIRARELAEKRRVAPGWLDSDARLLEPERKNGTPVGGEAAGQFYGEGAGQSSANGGPSEMAVPDEAAELDRAFGKMQLGTWSQPSR